MIYLFLADGFEILEAYSTVDVCRRAGLSITTVSVMPQRTVVSSQQIPVTADALFQEVDLSDAQMLVLPGGMPGALNLDGHHGLRDALLHQAETGRPIAAICAAPLVLGHLGILEGKKATCYPGFEKELQGATPTGALVQEDDNIITGKGPAAALDFAFTIVQRLTDAQTVAQVKAGMLFN